MKNLKKNKVLIAFIIGMVFQVIFSLIVEKTGFTATGNTFAAVISAASIVGMILVSCSCMPEGSQKEKHELEHIKIKYLADIEKIKPITVGDWIDLRAAQDIHMKAGQYTMIPLGIAMELPKGYEALVVPRSSTFKKYGLLSANSIGVIDEAYKGDDDQWHFPCIAFHETDIKKDERICQFRIIKHQPTIKMVEVESLGNENRGGFGSTGMM